MNKIHDDSFVLTYELEKIIKRECEAWADWSRMSEDEKDETFDGYESVAVYQHERDMSVISAVRAENEQIKKRLTNAMEALEMTMNVGVTDFARVTLEDLKCGF